VRFDEALFWELVFGNLYIRKESEGPAKWVFLMKGYFR
jgi:hypothetical protein